MSSETLKEKYKYMCGLAEDMSREVYEQNKIIAGAQKTEELLKDFVSNMFELNNGEYSVKEIDRSIAYWKTNFKKNGIDVYERKPWAITNEYIYESPDGGETVYKRKFGENTREKIK